MFSYDAYKMVDLAPIFEVAPSEGYLLQNLNIFDKSSSNGIYVMLDRLIEDNKTLLNQPKNVTVLNTTQRLGLLLTASL